MCSDTDGIIRFESDIVAKRELRICRYSVRQREQSCLAEADSTLRMF